MFKKIIVALFVVGISILNVGCGSENKDLSKDSDVKSSQEVKNTAITLCKLLVENEIKPHKADFPFGDYKIFTTSKNRYVVKSSVTAISSNNNELELNYHCDVEYNGSGNLMDNKNWKLYNLELVPK